MKKISNKKILFTTTVFLVLFISVLSAVSFSYAEDDEDDNEREDRYKYNGPVVQENNQVIQPGENQIKVPLPTATQAVIIATSTPITTIINKTTVVSVPDNSAILAALLDSDKDGIPDLLDKYPGEDDSIYLLLDRNGNGIADDLEILLK